MVNLVLVLKPGCGHIPLSNSLTLLKPEIPKMKFNWAALAAIAATIIAVGTMAKVYIDLIKDDGGPVTVTENSGIAVGENKSPVVGENEGVINIVEGDLYIGPTAKEITTEPAEKTQSDKDGESSDQKDTRPLAARLGKLLREPLTEVARRHHMKQNDTIFVQHILDSAQQASDLGETIRRVLRSQLRSEIVLRRVTEPERADYALQGAIVNIDPNKRELQLKFLRKAGLLNWETLETIRVPLDGVEEIGYPDRIYPMDCATGNHPCDKNNPRKENACRIDNIGKALRFARAKAEIKIQEQRGGATSIQHEQRLDFLKDRTDKDVAEMETKGRSISTEDGNVPRIVGGEVRVERCAQVLGNTSSP
uniref:Uncharacterized protein n=1 Tax=Candidatus Kentrum sp. UNK TaxID=2126344 RepID=A0A451B4Z5_9GAMM|nr:MAG: hypothetical protein BECKUNK1418G_GA0071005_11932 [Candidatus Kentron sp. UNK]VFK73345.1 MAG: hypothetical protein BECKUNK1418H_GA0071006_11912 [Candidatus Kentron sp. UNK]